MTFVTFAQKCTSFFVTATFPAVVVALISTDISHICQIINIIV